MKRREFIHSISHAMAASAIHSNFNFLDEKRNYSVLSNTLNTDNIVVFVELSGGNDGLNTIAPMDQYATLTKVRPHVIISENKLIALGKNDLALHPSLADLKILSDEKRMKIIQNVGYNNPDLSHFRSSDIIQSGSGFSDFVPSGWAGRLCETLHPDYPEKYPNDLFPDPLAVELTAGMPLMFTGTKSFPGYLGGSPDSFNEINTSLDNKYPNTFSGDKLSYIQQITSQANRYGIQLKKAYQLGNHKIQFPDGDMGGQFYRLSRLIRGGLNTRFYHTGFGGFDTHDNQVLASDHTLGKHASLLKTLNDCIISLMKSLDETKDSDRVLIVVFSEFGRRIVSRGSGGTDHGAAWPMMIFGNKINPKVAGKNPKINPLATPDDNLEAEFDYRQIYASIIEQWLGGDFAVQKKVLFKEYGQVSITKEYDDNDGDGILDKYDNCLNTAAGAMVDTNGCEVFSLPPETFSVTVNSASCIGQKNGSVVISTKNTNNSYTIHLGADIVGKLNTQNNYSQIIGNLGNGTYQICIKVDGITNYERCYSFKISEPPALNASVKVDNVTESLKVNLGGSEMYQVTFNENKFETKESELDLKLTKGLNKIRVSTSKECQGVFFREIFVSEECTVFPNPTTGPMNVFINGSDDSVEVLIHTSSGTLIEQSQKIIPFNRVVKFDLSSCASGVYLISLKGKTVQSSSKIVKI
ncbi:MAG: hypothetical protein RJA67_78 [Bacteroidota bacterium]|jgi:uncharacterized protein (DUF1501 family)